MSIEPTATTAVLDIKRTYILYSVLSHTSTKIRYGTTATVDLSIDIFVGFMISTNLKSLDCFPNTSYVVVPAYAHCTSPYSFSYSTYLPR